MAQSTNDHFFQVLRFSVGASKEMPSHLSSSEWRSIYEKAQQQSLLGLIFYGIEQCPSLSIEWKLLLRWCALSERIRNNNVRTNTTAAELTARFKEQGFRTCILKGQGNTLNYPAPYIRSSGDIDIWVEGGTEKVLKIAREKFTCSKACYHHVDAGTFQGVEVEVHYRPSFMNNLIHNQRMQRWFEEMKEEQFTHEVNLPNDAGTIFVPTHAFNRIYQLAHIYNHLLHEGIGLRQIVDYYYVLKQGFTAEEQAKEIQLLKHLGLYKIATAVMYVLKEILLLEDTYLLVPPNERLGLFVLDEIMQAGNFGQYDTRVSHGGSQWNKNIRRLQRDIRLMRYFPSECLWEPIFRWYHFFWRQTHK